jgi:glucose/arabinose dehydrogenase
LVLGFESLLCIAVVLWGVGCAISRRRDTLRLSGVTVVALSVLIVSEVIGAGLLEAGRPATMAAQAAAAKVGPTRTATPGPATPAAAPTADAEVLQSFSMAWSDVVRVTAAALKAHDSAGESLSHENIPAASHELENCEGSAAAIGAHAYPLRLDPQIVSDRDLLIAITNVGDDLQSVCRSARSYLDTRSAADFADAKTHFAKVVDGMFQAESLARQKYQRLGGNPDALLSFKTALR